MSDNGKKKIDEPPTVSADKHIEIDSHQTVESTWESTQVEEIVEPQKKKKMLVGADWAKKLEERRIGSDTEKSTSNVAQVEETQVS